jgi:hypothetical protein
MTKHITMPNTGDISLAIDHIADPAPAIEVRTYYLTRALVDCGAGYAIVDEFTASSAGKDSSLIYIETELSIGRTHMGKSAGFTRTAGPDRPAACQAGA